MPTTPRLLQHQRVLARGAWEREAWHHPYGVRSRWCSCGHTKNFHELYHQRADGEWEECFPIHEAPCDSARTLCEVCDECRKYEEAGVGSSARA